jgi:hypothetical protein
VGGNDSTSGIEPIEHARRFIEGAPKCCGVFAQIMVDLMPEYAFSYPSLSNMGNGHLPRKSLQLQISQAERVSHSLTEIVF